MALQKAMSAAEGEPVQTLTVADEETQMPFVSTKALEHDVCGGAHSLAPPFWLGTSPLAHVAGCAEPPAQNLPTGQGAHTAIAPAVTPVS